MTRYFQDALGNILVAGTRPGDWNADHLATRPGHTEVQVVPLDAIVIRREEVPEVTGSITGPGNLNAGGVHFDPSWSPEDARDMALRYLAAEAYLREHPPVDETQVKALADLLDSDPGEDALESGDTDALARFLVEYGVRVEVKP